MKERGGRREDLGGRREVLWREEMEKEMVEGAGRVGWEEGTDGG